MVLLNLCSLSDDGGGFNMPSCFSRGRGASYRNSSRHIFNYSNCKGSPRFNSRHELRSQNPSFPGEAPATLDPFNGRLFKLHPARYCLLIIIPPVGDRLHTNGHYRLRCYAAKLRDRGGGWRDAAQNVQHYRRGNQSNRPLRGNDFYHA